MKRNAYDAGFLNFTNVLGLTESIRYLVFDLSFGLNVVIGRASLLFFGQGPTGNFKMCSSTSVNPASSIQPFRYLGELAGVQTHGTL